MLPANRPHAGLAMLACADTGYTAGLQSRTGQSVSVVQKLGFILGNLHKLPRIAVRAQAVIFVLDVNFLH
jgi:hypothetical protein